MRACARRALSGTPIARRGLRNRPPPRRAARVASRRAAPREIVAGHRATADVIRLYEHLATHEVADLVKYLHDDFHKVRWR